MKRVLTRVKEECPEVFWTLACEGLSTTSFMHWKGTGFSGCYVATCDAMDAERFASKAELTKAMKHDDDVKEFMENYPDAVPVKVVVKVEVYRNDTVRVAKHVR